MKKRPTRGDQPLRFFSVPSPARSAPPSRLSLAEPCPALPSCAVPCCASPSSAAPRFRAVPRHDALGKRQPSLEAGPQQRISRPVLLTFVNQPARNGLARDIAHRDGSTRLSTSCTAYAHLPPGRVWRTGTRLRWTELTRLNPRGILLLVPADAGRRYHVGHLGRGVAGEKPCTAQPKIPRSPCACRS
jgi:hypothetical protein